MGQEDLDSHLIDISELNTSSGLSAPTCGGRIPITY